MPSPVRKDEPVSPFIDILPEMSSPVSEWCTMEIKDENGAALRVRIRSTVA